MQFIILQNELARAEANVICNTDNQYIVPTSGNPVRGLIQDHVASGVKLTCKNTFLNRAQYQQLLYVALSGLPGTEITTYAEVSLLISCAVIQDLTFFVPVSRISGFPRRRYGSRSGCGRASK